MKARKNFLVMGALALSMVISGCGKDDDGVQQQLQERAKAENQGALEVDQQVANAMEADLRRKWNFYSAVEGYFEGNFVVGEVEYGVRIKLDPSIPIYQPSDRIRTIGEVESDLINLSFNAQILQWDLDNPENAVGCRIEGVRPDILNGQISITYESCPSSFVFNLVDSSGISEMSSEDIIKSSNRNTSRVFSASVLGGKVNTVDVLSGLMQPSTSSNQYSFLLKRMEEN